MTGFKKQITQQEQARIHLKKLQNNYQKALDYIESNNLENVSAYRIQDSIVVEGLISEYHKDNIKSLLIDGKEKT